MARLVIAHDDAVAPRAWAGLGIVAGASFVTSLDALVLYVAFGAIHRDFPHIGAPALSWIFSGYTIVVAAGMIAAGCWADRLGRRRVFLGGMGVITAESAICAFAPDARVLIAARVLQGFWAAAGALAAALGPTVGGLCVEAWGWRSVFVLNVPIGVAVALLGPRLLDESREPAGSRLPDPVGTVLVTAALVLLALALVQSSAWGWSSARTVGALL